MPLDGRAHLASGGVVDDNDRLQREGEAQQAQATEKLRALRKELCEGEEVRQVVRPLSPVHCAMRGEWFWWSLATAPALVYLLGIGDAMPQANAALWLLL